MENLGRDYYVFLQLKDILPYSTPVLLLELRSDQEQVAAAAHIVSSCAQLHRQRFSRAGQVAKSRLCFGEILIFQQLYHGKKGLWLKASLLALTQVRLKLGPGFQRVLLFIFFHWHHVPKRTDCLKSAPSDGPSTMNVYLLQWLWCFHLCPLCSLIPIP